MLAAAHVVGHSVGSEGESSHCRHVLSSTIIVGEGHGGSHAPTSIVVLACRHVHSVGCHVEVAVVLCCCPGDLVVHVSFSFGLVFRLLL